jgi:hypothetical protein
MGTENDTSWMSCLLFLTMDSPSKSNQMDLDTDGGISLSCGISDG